MLVKEILKHPDLKDTLRPAVFVGHASGSPDGMNWEDQQSQTLHQFTIGHHNLLVATDVLREGIDVPVCNNVILFDQTAMTLIAFLQSRGRARAASSRYFLICNVEEEKSYKNLISAESLMDNVVFKRMGHDCAVNFCPHHNALLNLHSVSLVNRIQNFEWDRRPSEFLGDHGEMSLNDIEEVIFSIRNLWRAFSFSQSS